MKHFHKHLGLLGSVVTIIGFIVSYFLPTAYQVYAGGGVLFFTMAWLSFLLGRRSQVTNGGRLTFKQDFSDALLEFLNTKKLNRQNAEIIRWGTALSKPLALNQKYEIRRKVGEFIEDAAIKMDDYKAWIKALIEDQGWTSVELLDYALAEKKLTKGIALALEHNELYMLAKGYRYLFSVHFRQNSLITAEDFLNMSLEITKKLPDDKGKDEIVAEYHFAKSSLEHKKQNLSLALEEIQKAKAEYEKLTDKEWLIKISARKGEILVAMNEIEEAKAIFIKGLDDSEKLQFNRQIVKNLIGLGMCDSAVRKDADAKESLFQAKEIAENIGMYYELEIINRELKRIGPR